MNRLSKLALVCLALTSACTETPPVISIDPSMVELAPKEMKRFYVTVTNAKDGSVRWDATKGTIDALGVFTAPDEEGTVTITATLMEKPSINTTAKVTVKSAGPKVALSPQTLQLKSGGTFLFTASVTGLQDDGVEWSVVENTMESMAAGTIDAAGLYTAPETLGTYTVRATSVVDSKVYGESKVTVVQNLPLVIAPAAIELRVGQTVKFTSIATSADAGDVRWELAPQTAPGTLMQDGTFTASPTEGGEFQVRVVSKKEASLVAVASVRVRKPAIDISGTVVNMTGETGPVAISSDAPFYPSWGVNLRAPGHFVIKGFENGWALVEQYMFAFIDTRGGTNITQPDCGFVFWTLDHAMAEQSVTMVPEMPNVTSGKHLIVAVEIVGTTAAVSFVGAEDDLGGELGTAYRIDYSEQPNPGPTNRAGSLTVPATAYAGMTTAMVTGLTPGKQYHFAVTSTWHGMDTSSSDPTDAIAVGTPSPGTKTIRGTVRLGSLQLNRGKLYAIARSFVPGDFFFNPGSYRMAVLGTPTTANVPFTISNLEADKEYVVTYFWDIDGDGAFTFGTDRRSSIAEMATVQANDERTDIELKAVQGARSIEVAQVVTIDQASKQYLLNVLIHPGSKILFNLTRRPTASHAYAQSTWMPQFGNYFYRYNYFDNGTQAAPVFYGTQPFVGGSKITYDLEYVDGSTEVVEVTVPEPIEVAQLEPLAAAGSAPTFKWGALPANLTAKQTLTVGDDTGVQWVYELPAGTTQATFNADGTASAPQLTPGHPATWTVTTTIGETVSKSSWTFTVKPDGQ